MVCQFTKNCYVRLIIGSDLHSSPAFNTFSFKKQSTIIEERDINITIHNDIQMEEPQITNLASGYNESKISQSKPSRSGK